VAKKSGHNLQDVHLKRMIEHMRFGFLTPSEWDGFFLGFAVGVYVFTNGRLVEHSWTPLSFAIHIVAKLFFSRLCLFDATVELHPMIEKNVQ
jgi:hypothetical protein